MCEVPYGLPSANFGRGPPDPDAPVAAYWPEFAAAGKESVLVRHLLAHRAGPAGLREPHSIDQLSYWELTTSRCAATEPWWEPGTRCGYHAVTYGFLVGEAVRRVTCLLPGEFPHREVTGPLGIDFTIGPPEKEAARAAEAHTAAWRAAGIPAANGHGTARAVAALYGILAGRGRAGEHRVLSSETVERVRDGEGGCRYLVRARASPMTRRSVSGSG